MDHASVAPELQVTRAVDQAPRHRALRRVLVLAVLLLVVGVVLFAAMSGLAADPMTGT